MKAIYLTVAAIGISAGLSAQCHVYDVPSVDQGNADCYIDYVTLDGNPMSTGSGIQATGNSYQNFTTPLITVSQGQQFNLSIGGSMNGNYSQRAWIDFNNDSIYDGSELVASSINVNSPGIGYFVDVPYTAIPDTVHMRVLKYDGGSGIPDPCYNWFYGEAEDYRLVVVCGNYNFANYNGSNFLCYEDSLMLDAFTPYGDVTWYTDTLLGPQYTGNFFTLHMNGFTSDTIIYIQNTTAGCYDGPLTPVQLTFMPSPVVDIVGPDTIQSCTSITLDAGPGHQNYIWSNGDQTQTTTITNGWGGNLSVMVDNQFGCFAMDEVYLHVAPNAPATYAHLYPTFNFCGTNEILLQYDSLVNPGTVNWLTYPSGTPIGAGAQLLYILPDTGYFQYQAVINSVCGTDTAVLGIYNGGLPTYDSLYITNASQDSTGLYTMCGGNVDLIIGGFNGMVDHWELNDTTNMMSFPWYDDDTLTIPVALLQMGSVYSAYALIENAQGCEDTTALIYFTRSNTLAVSWSDTMWRCTFPTTLSVPSVNYAVYDILWSTGDTTTSINVSGPGAYSIYTIDHSTGCTINEQTYLANGSLPDNPYPDTLVVCDPMATLDPSQFGYNAYYWWEYDNSWSMINQDGNSFYTVYDMGFDPYIVMDGENNHGCSVMDTVLIDFGGNFTFSLGPDVTTVQNPYTITGPPNMQSYMWSPGGQPTQSVQVTMSGTYTLTVNNGHGCFYTDVITITIDPMGTQPVENANAITVYPNPANEVVNVQSAEAIQAVNIYDAEGRLVRTQNENQSNSVEIFVGDLATGFYHLEVITSTGKQQEKLVITR